MSEVDREEGGQPGEAPGLEGRLRRLEKIVAELEGEEVELDRALELFEEGVAHVREAEKLLSEAELRVEELLDDEGSTREFERGAESGEEG